MLHYMIAGEIEKGPAARLSPNVIALAYASFYKNHILCWGGGVIWSKY